MPYDVGGVVEPVALTIALDDWAKSVRRWELVLNEKAPITDLTPDGRKRKRRDSKARIAQDNGIQPSPAGCVLRDIFAKRVDQDIDVRKHHLKCFMRSMYSRSSVSW